MNISYVVAVLIAGMLFGAGLTLSTMVQPEAVLQFLNFNDFGLLLVLGCATVNHAGIPAGTKSDAASAVSTEFFWQAKTAAAANGRWRCAVWYWLGHFRCLPGACGGWFRNGELAINLDAYGDVCRCLCAGALVCQMNVLAAID